MHAGLENQGLQAPPILPSVIHRFGPRCNFSALAEHCASGQK